MKIVGWLMLLAAAIFGFLAYFIVKIDNNMARDGLGRELFPSPVPLRMAGIQEWAGPAWNMADCAIFFILVGFGATIVKISEKRSTVGNGG